MNELENCPSCNSKPFEEAKFPRYMRTILNEIKLKCPFNCEEILNYDNLKNHLVCCQNFEKPYVCTSCSQSLRVYDQFSSILKNHISNCENRIIKCEFCGNELVWKELSSHENVCEQKPIKCEKCLVGYLNKFEPAHSECYCMLISSIVQILIN
jgi:hypothetical protein